MNILIFTPTSQLSSVGQQVCLLTHTLLKQGHQINVVGTEDFSMLKKTSEYDFGTPITAWNSFDTVKLLSELTDAVVYAIGDNYTYHRGSLEWISKLPGVVCLYDNVLLHLFCEWSLEHKSDAQAVIENWYGKKAVEFFFNSSFSQEFFENNGNHYSMVEWIASKANAVLTQSTLGIQQIISSCPGTVCTIPLAHLFTGKESSDTEMEKYAIKILEIISQTIKYSAILQALNFYTQTLSQWGASEITVELVAKNMVNKPNGIFSNMIESSDFPE